MASPFNLSFDSLYRYERASIKGSVAFHLANPPYTLTLTIPHNLGYKPFFRAWYGFGDGRYFQAFAGAQSHDLDGNDFQLDNTNADATNIYFTIVNENLTPGVVLNGTMYYRIYAEPQSD